MPMDDCKRKEILLQLGAEPNKIDGLLNYLSNVFSPCAPDDDSGFLEKWGQIIQYAERYGAVEAINRYLATKNLQVEFMLPKTIEIELFQSIGGIIPIITVKNIKDFEAIIHNVIAKGKGAPVPGNMGAVFAFGKHNRFIVLSDKCYANISAEQAGIDEAAWKEKSLTIRKHHECAHYFTKRFFGSSKNNLHDEIIADFCGIYAAFGKYDANLFLLCMGLIDNSSGATGRLGIYTQGLSENELEVVSKLAVIAAKKIEEWSKTVSFFEMSEMERMKVLCQNELLAWV